MASAFAAGTGSAGLGLALDGSALADTAPPSDTELLSKAHEVEGLMVVAYRQVLASGALSPLVGRVAASQLGDERAHLAAVGGALTRLGAAPAAGSLSLKAATAALDRHHVSGSLTDLHTEHDCLKLLVDLESVAEGIYYTALKDLRHAGPVHLAAQIMACEAQHWTVLSGLRNPGQYVKAVPWPYVYGSK